MNSPGKPHAGSPGAALATATSALRREALAFKALLQRGVKLVKHSRWGAPHMRLLVLDSGGDKLVWGPPPAPGSAADRDIMHTTTATPTTTASKPASTKRVKGRRMSDGASAVGRLLLQQQQPASELGSTTGDARAKFVLTMVGAPKGKKCVALGSLGGVSRGAVTPVFTKRARASVAAVQDRCFSLLVTSVCTKAEGRASLDFEARSREDRDAMVQGFVLLGALQPENFVLEHFVLYTAPGSASSSSSAVGDAGASPRGGGQHGQLDASIVRKHPLLLQEVAAACVESGKRGNSSEA